MSENTILYGASRKQCQKTQHYTEHLIKLTRTTGETAWLLCCVVLCCVVLCCVVLCCVVLCCVVLCCVVLCLHQETVTVFFLPNISAGRSFSFSMPTAMNILAA